MSPTDRTDRGFFLTTFVLVHGAWHGGWCYRGVASQLRARGHEVFTPTLTGLGDRSHQFRADINLEDHVSDVLQLVRYEELADIVLVGHSYGGMVVSAVADRAPDIVSALVYIDAFVPEDRRSVFDYAPPEAVTMMRSSAASDGGIPWIGAAALEVNEADAAWVDRRCGKQPLATFEQPIRLLHEVADLFIRKVYVGASKSRDSHFGRLIEQFWADPAWTTYIVDSGHDVMIDEPTRLVEILVDIDAGNFESSVGSQ